MSEADYEYVEALCRVPPAPDPEKAELVAMLKRLEWADSCERCGEHSHCSVCGRPAYALHKEECELVALLRRIEGGEG